MDVIVEDKKLPAADFAAAWAAIKIEDSVKQRLAAQAPREAFDLALRDGFAGGIAGIADEDEVRTLAQGMAG